MAAGGLGAVVAAPTVIITDSFSKDAGASAKELRKVWGTTGATKIKRDQKKKEFKLQEEIKREYLDDEESSKSNTGTEDQSKNT